MALGQASANPRAVTAPIRDFILMSLPFREGYVAVGRR